MDAWQMANRDNNADIDAIEDRLDKAVMDFWEEEQALMKKMHEKDAALNKRIVILEKRVKESVVRLEAAAAPPRGWLLPFAVIGLGIYGFVFGMYYYIGNLK